MRLKRLFQGSVETWPFSAGVNLWSFLTITFKIGGLYVRALRCNQGSHVGPLHDKMLANTEFR